MHTTFRIIALSVAMLAALLLAACSPAPDTQNVSPIDTPLVPTPADTPSPVARGDEGEAMVESARVELANLLGIPSQNIQLVSVEQVNWRDSSLGCPKEGEMYTQAIVPGQRIVLQVGDEQYTYHTGNGHVVLCQDEERTPPAATPEILLDPEVAALVEQAKKELTDRAGVAIEDITVQQVEAVQWRDSSLGCPVPGMQYLQVITPGYLILLEADGEVYEYHTDQNSVIYCENPSQQEDPSTAVKLIAAARADLASVAGVSADEIEVLESRYVDWPDASLGCPKAGQSYPQVVTPGFLIRLRAAGEEYEYHTSMTDIVLCRK